MDLNRRQFVDSSMRGMKKGLEENKDVARRGGGAAKKARLEIEKQTGEGIVNAGNSKKMIGKG